MTNHPPSPSAQQYIIWRQSHGQVTKVPGRAPNITTEYSADSRNRTPQDRITLHILKLKPHASINNKIGKIHNFQFIVVFIGVWFVHKQLFLQVTSSLNVCELPLMIYIFTSSIIELGSFAELKLPHLTFLVCYNFI